MTIVGDHLYIEADGDLDEDFLLDLDMALHVASGRDYASKRVERFMAEGEQIDHRPAGGEGTRARKRSASTTTRVTSAGVSKRGDPAMKRRSRSSIRGAAGVPTRRVCAGICQARVPAS